MRETKRAAFLLAVLLFSTVASAQTTIFWKKDFIADDSGVTVATATPVPTDTTAPSAPSGIGYSGVTATSATITWSGSTDTGGSGLAGYKIYRGPIPIAAVAHTATSFQDVTLQPQTSYVFKVVAFDAAGNHSTTNGSASVSTLPVTSYCNPGGKGNRTTSVGMSTSWALFNVFGGNVPSLVNGNRSTENSIYFYGGNVANAWIQFDFGSGSSKFVDEAKYYQQNTTSEGTWKWQGSSNGSAWTDIGSSFTLGGVATQTLSTLSGNTASYRYYRLLGVSGTTSNNPWIYEFEFKIDGGSGCAAPPAPVTTSYSNPGGSGDRTASITTAASWALFNNFGSSHQALVNGNQSQSDYFYGNAAVYDRTLEFDFGTGRVIDEVKYYQSNSTSHGTWKWQGSNDHVAWDDVGGSFTLGGASTQTQTTLNGNTYGFRYYRILGLSGNSSTSPWVYEFEFKIDDGS